MYKIIGADQKEDGLIPAEQIRHWIAEGRLNAQTLACGEGSQEWKPLAMFPEFGLGSAAAGAIPGATSEASPAPEEIVTRDYQLDIMDCISRGWELLKNNFGTLFLGFLLLVIAGAVVGGVIGGIAAGLSQGQLAHSAAFQGIIRIITGAVGALVLGPLTGGLYLANIKAIRGEPIQVSDIFLGFQKSFSQLFLGKLVTGLVGGACVLPWTLIYSAKMNAITEQMRNNTSPDRVQELFHQMFSVFAGSLPVLLLCMIPATYFAVNWLFALALIIDKQMPFWPAMTLSWKMVHKHWFQVFGLVVVVGLLSLVGFCMCCIGVLVTAPIGIAATMYAYETIFGRQTY